MTELEPDTPITPVDSWAEVDPDWVPFADPDLGALEESAAEDLSEEELTQEPEEGDALEGPRWVRFELWAQNLSDGTERYLASTADFDGPLEVEIGNLPPGDLMRFWVRLIDSNGRHSNMSDPIDLRLPVDLTPPGRPTAPTVAEAFGLVAIHHDGELESGVKPDDFSHIVLYAQQMHPPGNPSGPPGGARAITRITQESSTVVGDFFSGIPHRVFAVAVDTTGNESARSEYVEVTPRMPFDDTELQETLRNLNEEVLPKLAGEQELLEQAMEHLNTVELPGLQAQLESGLAGIEQNRVQLQQLSEEQVKLDEAMDHLNEVELPGLETRLRGGIDEVNKNLIPLQQLSGQNKSRLDTLNNTTLPGIERNLQAVESDLSTAKGQLSTAQGQLNTLRNTTVPGITSDLEAAQGQLSTARGQLNTLNNSTIPSITRDLEAAQGLISTIDSTALRDQTGVIKANHMSANSVVANSIAANAVTTAKIATGAVTANEIAALTITANELATNSVTAGKILANAVTTAKIATGAVTANEIAALTITANELASNSVTAGKILANAVTTAKIAANAVTANEIAANTITAGNIATNAVQTRHLQANSVGADQIVANSIGANHLQVNSVQAMHMQVGSFDNLYPDPNFDIFRDHGASAASPYASIVGSAQDRWRYSNHSTVGASLLMTTGNAGAASRLEAYCGKVIPGEEYSFSLMVRTDVTSGSGFTVRARHRGENRASPFSTVTLGSNLSPGSSGTTYNWSWTVPSNSDIREMWIDLERSATSTGAVRITNPYLRRRIDSQVLVDGAVITDKLAANAVVADKIATNAIQTRHITAGSVSTNELAANAVNADRIAANAVTTAKIATNAVRANEIAGNTIVAGNIASNAIQTRHITAGSVSTNELAASAVNADKIASNAITTAKIAANAVGANEIAANAITASQIRAGAIDGMLITGAVVRGGEIHAGANSEGALIPDEGRLRIQGRMPRAEAGARDTFTTGTTPAMRFTASSWVDNGTAVRTSYMIHYAAPAPTGNRHTIVSLHGDTVNMEGPGTVTSRAQNPGQFQAIVRSAGPSGTHGDVRIRYLSIWTDSSA